MLAQCFNEPINEWNHDHYVLSKTLHRRHAEQTHVSIWICMLCFFVVVPCTIASASAGPPSGWKFRPAKEQCHAEYDFFKPQRIMQQIGWYKQAFRFWIPQEIGFHYIVNEFRLDSKSFPKLQPVLLAISSMYESCVANDEAFEKLMEFGACWDEASNTAMQSFDCRFRCPGRHALFQCVAQHMENAPPPVRLYRQDWLTMMFAFLLHYLLNTWAVDL